MTGVPAIGFRYRPSRVLLAVTLTAAALALVAIWLLAASHWTHLALSLAVGAVAGAAVSRALRPRVASVVWRADGGTDLGLHDTVADPRREVLGRVSASRVIGPLIVLTLRWPPRERAHLWLLPDNLDADTRRRLRMRAGAAAGRHAASGSADGS